MIINVSILVSHARNSSGDDLAAFADRLAEDIGPELERASGTRWRFHMGEPIQLGSDERRHAGDFVGKATYRSWRVRLT